MSCNRWQREIEESFGEQNGEPDAALEAHLATCDDCRALAEAQQRLRATTAALPRSVEPARDLWPGIAARLEPRRTAGPIPETAPVAAPPRWRWRSAALRLAAAVLLVLAGGILSRWLLAPPQPPAGAGVPGRGAAATQLTSTPSLAVAIDDYRAAKTALEAAVAARREEGPQAVSESTAAVIERNLRIIDRAIVELEAALSEDPGNPGLETLLLARYQQEIELLRRLAVGSRS